MWRVIFLVISLILVRKLVLAIDRWNESRKSTREEATPAPFVLEQYLLLILRTAEFTRTSEELESATQRAWGQMAFGLPSGPTYVDRWSPGMTVLEVSGSAVLIAGTPFEGRRREIPLQFIPGDSDQVWNQFSHDVSVGVAYIFEHDGRQVCELLGRLAAEFCDEKSIAISHPFSRRMWAIDEETINRLRNRPGEFFYFEEGPTKAD